MKLHFMQMRKSSINGLLAPNYQDAEMEISSGKELDSERGREERKGWRVGFTYR